MKKEKFRVLENYISIPTKKYSLLIDSKNQQHIIPIKLALGFIELSYEINENGKFIFDLTSLRFDSIDDGSIITIRLLEKTFISNNRLQKIPVFLAQWEKVLFHLNALDWQVSNFYTIPKKINVQIKKNASGVTLTQLIDENNKHHFFEIGTLYEFELLAIKEILKKKYLILEGKDGCHYKCKAFFNQHLNSFKEKKIRCVFNGYDSKGNLKLSQADRISLKLHDVLKKNSENFSSIIRPLLLQLNEYKDYVDQYESSDNRWLLSLAKCFEKSLKQSLEQKDFASSDAIVKCYIEIEEYILESGYTTDFSTDKALEIENFSKSKIKYLILLKDPITCLKNLDFEIAIEKWLKEITSNASKDLVALNLKKINLTFHFGGASFFSEHIIFNIYQLFLTMPEIDSSEIQTIDNIISFFKFYIKRIEMNLFYKVFFDGKSKKNFYKNNNDLLIYFSLSNLCSYILLKFKNLGFNLYQVKCMRSISLYNFNQSSLEIQFRLISLLQNGLPEKTAFFELLYYNSENITNIPKTSLENKSEPSNLKWEEVINDFYEGKILEEPISGKDEIGYYLIYKDIKGYLDSTLMRDYEAAYYFYNSKKKKPKTKIIALNKALNSILLGYIKEEIKINSVKDLQVGKVEEGIVTSFTKSGAFVLIGNTQCFIHKTEMDWGPISYPQDLFFKGATYSFVIKEIPKNERVLLSYKVQFDDPWPYIRNITNKKYECIFLRKISLGYLKDYYNIDFTNQDNDYLITDCPRCKNSFQTHNSLIIDFHKKNWSCTNINCSFSGEEGYLFRVKNYPINTFVKHNDLNEDEKIEIQKIQRGDVIAIYIYQYNIIKRHTYGLIENFKPIQRVELEPHESDKIENSMILELAKCFEDISTFYEKSEEELSNIRWAKHLYSISGNSKSYFFNVYILFIELILNLKKAKQGDKNGISELQVKIDYLLKNNEELEITKRIYKELENHLKIFKYFLLLGNFHYDNNVLLLKANYDEGTHNTSVKNFASIILTHNLLLAHSPNNKKEFEKRTYAYMYETLTKGNLNNIDGGVNEKDLADEIELEKRKKLLKLIHEGEGKKIEFKSSFFTPILNPNFTSELQKLQSKIDQALISNNSELSNRLIKEKESKFKIASETELKHSVVKEIAAFANTEGGTLIIGVNDQKDIIGLEEDFKKISKKEKYDDFLLRFDECIKIYLGDNVNRLLKSEFIHINDKSIFICEVLENIQKQNPIVVKINSNGSPDSELYVRAAASARKLTTSETIAYINSYNSN